MFRTWKLGQAFGIDLFVHWTFMLLPLLVLFSNLGNGLTIAVVGAAIAVAVFGCVLLHELGHALMARTFGIGTRDITLYPIGGVARLEGMPEKPGAEIAIAVAGPAVNVAIAGGLTLGLYLAGMFPLSQLFVYDSIPQLFVVNLLIANIGLVIFNMIPAFPMDGGRVLRAILSLFIGRFRATEVASSIGSLFALLFIIGGAFYSQFTLMLVGMFVFFAGRQERAQVRYLERQRYVRDWSGPTITVEPASSENPSPGFTGLVWEPTRQVWVMWRNGRPASA